MSGVDFRGRCTRCGKVVDSTAGCDCERVKVLTVGASNVVTKDTLLQGINLSLANGYALEQEKNAVLRSEVARLKQELTGVEAARDKYEWEARQRREERTAYGAEVARLREQLDAAEGRLNVRKKRVAGLILRLKFMQEQLDARDRLIGELLDELGYIAADCTPRIGMSDWLAAKRAEWEAQKGNAPGENVPVQYEECSYCHGRKIPGTKCVGNDECIYGTDGKAAECCEGWGDMCCQCGASYAKGQM